MCLRFAPTGNLSMMGYIFCMLAAHAACAPAPAYGQAWTVWSGLLLGEGFSPSHATGDGHQAVSVCWLRQQRSQGGLALKESVAHAATRSCAFKSCHLCASPHGAHDGGFTAAHPAHLPDARLFPLRAFTAPASDRWEAWLYTR